MCKDSLDLPKERLDELRTVFAQCLCQAISNHFAHSLLLTNDSTAGISAQKWDNGSWLKPVSTVAPLNRSRGIRCEPEET